MYNKFIDMLTILGTVGILILVCLFSVLHLQIGPPMVEATPFQVQSISKGGTGATTAADARTNLGVASETHASRHESSAADEIDVTPDMITLAEGKIVVGAATGEGEATDEIPNLSITAFPTSDDTWSGLSITGTAGYATAQWDVVFLDSVSDNNKFEKADANESGDFPAWGLAVEAVSADASLTVIVKGCIRNDGWNGTYTHGDLLYLDETTAGALIGSASAPDTTGDCVQPIGRFFDKGSDTYLCIDVNHVSGWATVP